MVSNFEEVITGLRQCQEKLFSDNGVMGCLVSIEAEVEEVKTILSAIDDPHAYEIIFLLSRVLELIHIIYDQDLQSYDKRARELEKKIQGKAYSSSSFNISDRVKTDVFTIRGSAAAGGMREPEVQLRPVEAAGVGEVPPAQASAAKGTEIPRTVPDEVRPPAGSARESNMTLDAVEDPKVYRDGEISSTNKGTGTSEAQVKPENPQSEITPETGGTTKGREDTPHEISSGDHHTPKPEEPTEPEKPSPRGKREEVTTATEADAKNHVYHDAGLDDVRDVTDLTQARQELHNLPDGYGKTTGFMKYVGDNPRVADDLGGKVTHPKPMELQNESGEWRKVGRTKSQNDDLIAYVEQLKKEGVDDIRIDQQQVDIHGRKIGSNRPDLQFTKDGKRYYVEWDRTTSGREIGHAERIAANDPNHGGIELRIVDPYKK